MQASVEPRVEAGSRVGKMNDETWNGPIANSSHISNRCMAMLSSIPGLQTALL